MFLGDMGADVVKVERPKTGDPFRAFKGGLYSPHFQTYNRNKRSLTLDTREAADLEIFDRLVAEADIFIQNFRPASPKSSMSARAAAGAEPQADLLRHLGLRQHRAGCRPARLRHGRAGCQRLAQAADKPQEPARGGTRRLPIP